MKTRTLLGLLGVGAAAMVCVPFIPTNLGGRTTYVTTHGTSMGPRLHAGDLAVVQPSSHYRVGDIVAYHSTTLRGATLLHRIISIDAGRFTFKGDNNNFVDPDHPTVDQLVGRLTIRIPRGGVIRSWLARPIILFPLLALVIGGAGSSLFVRRRRQNRLRRRTPRRSARGFRPVGRSDRVHVVIFGATLLAAAGCLLAAVALWNVAPLERAAAAKPYRQTITLGYSGVAPAGAAYPDGKIRTGDPVFTRLVR